MKPVDGRCDRCGSRWDVWHTNTDCLAAQGRRVRLPELIKKATELAARIDDLTAQREEVLDDLRAYGPGDHESQVGSVHIRPAMRRFNPAKGIEFIPSEQRQQFVTVSLDAKLIKNVLTPEQLDQCMDAGTGKERVIFDD